MKILFYGAKDYDQQFFDKLKPPDVSQSGGFLYIHIL